MRCAEVKIWLTWMRMGTRSTSLGRVSSIAYLKRMVNWIMSDNEFYAMVRTEPSHDALASIQMEEVCTWKWWWDVNTHIYGIFFTRSTRCAGMWSSRAEWYTRHIQCVFDAHVIPRRLSMSASLWYNGNACNLFEWMSTQREPNVLLYSTVD